MTKCETCERAIFCESWGDYKCEWKQGRIYKKIKTCKGYKKKAADFEEKKCHCLVCMSRESE